MRYLRSAGMEAREAATHPARFGKHYDPHASVTLGDGALRVQAPGLDFVDLDGRMLAIHPDSVSWAFLTEGEARVLKDLSPGSSLSSIQDAWPGEATGDAADFVAALYRRGLVTLNGHRAIDEDMFRDGANVEEGRLVEILLTEKCNLACGYCLAGAGQDMPHMADETAKRTIDLAFAMPDTPSITFEFSGGEPFIKFELMRDLADYIHTHPLRGGRSVYLCVQTNATLLNEERVDWMAANNVIAGLSLDGDPDAHNLSRPQVNGKESLSKVLKGIDLMQSRGVNFGALVVLNRSNIGSVEGLVRFLVGQGVTRFKLNPIAFLGDARENWDEFSLGQDEIIDYFLGLAHMITREKLDLYETNIADMTRHIVSKSRQSRCLRGHCGAGDSFQAVAADGTIYPCGRATQSPGLAIGNVMEETVSLREPARRNLHMQQIRERRPKTLEDCVSCAYRELCQSGCSVQAWEKYGTVRSKTPECRYFKTIYPFLMRWLSFDADAVAHFNRGPYFGEGDPLEIAGETYIPGWGTA